MKSKYTKIFSIFAIILSLFVTPVHAYGNPYPGGWDNCTWSAWTLVNNYTGIEMPGWGNAGQWLANAAAQGWPTGSMPAANSVAVYSHHVVYVLSYDGGSEMYVQEGGYSGGYHEGYVPAFGPRHTQQLLGFIYLGGSVEYSPEAQQNYNNYIANAKIPDQPVLPKKEEIVIEVDPEAAMAEDVFLSSLKYEEIVLDETTEVTISYGKRKLIQMPKEKQS